MPHHCDRVGNMVGRTPRMNSGSISHRAPVILAFRRASLARAGVGLVILFLFSAIGLVRGALQFDVFLGYDGMVPEACWFPVVCEVKNDGPSFTGKVEIKTSNSQDPALFTTIELPTGTLKRFV